ncbi:TetR family transcriptional regulator [Pseudorhodoplanes sinuspersici]|uniref:TetR family transcriptional regulator n=2 Tax=Pseudorhodoplanes sinuspersici TaxID=1235591 RepID=A0A1W6ZZX4_9HYPH|nr:TetR/AcrR family transcriptional regulator [Pseudorhodoplanes sinuspersici]ARQ02870.1 TetR family transcriptional regulator [Pseudorhodoplanes sinuspersici]RKE70299.1 TetR family transcriptional regulator [Pseudorhodoplanes sinuspersici]
MKNDLPAARGRPRGFDRDAALRRAMEVFWAKGYDGAALSDLTAAMGINPPSLYAAFGSKEALFREAVDLYGTIEGNEIWAAIDEAPTARDAVRRFLEATANVFTRPGRPPGCLVVLGALHPNDSNENVCRVLKEKRADNIATLRNRLKRAVRDGELPKGVDTLAIATFYVTVQQGMSIQARDGASRETLRAVADSAMAAWDGLTTGAKKRA